MLSSTFDRRNRFVRKLLVLPLRLFKTSVLASLAKYLQFPVHEIVLDWIKRRKGRLTSDKTLVWPLSTQNLIHTDIKLG